MMKVTNVVLIIVLGISLMGCAKKTDSDEKVDLKDLPVVESTACYTINVSDPKEMVGFADYVFVGKVEELITIEYKYLEGMDQEAAEEVGKFPYTNYKITVLDNIKGSLQKDVLIPLQKMGGIMEDQSAIYLYEDDYLPKEGDICLFAVRILEDGSMYAEAENSSILISESTGKTRSAVEEEGFINSEIYQSYVEASKAPIETGEEHDISEYDTQFE